MKTDDSSIPFVPPGKAAGRRPVECGDLPFVIRRDGVWLYQGSPIARKELVQLFATVLRREADGSYWLQTPAERGRIQVEDAPFIAVAVEVQGDGADQVLIFRTNLEQIIVADAHHPLRVAQDDPRRGPVPYLVLRAGQGEWPIEARVSQSVYRDLVNLAHPGVIEGREVLGVWSHGTFFVLGECPADVE